MHPSAGSPLPEETTELENHIGYIFTNRGLFLEALTHKSFHHENPQDAPFFNERLEFLGDSVLAIVVVDYLFQITPQMTESLMSKIKSYIVQGKVLSELATQIRLGDYLRIGKGEEGTGGRKKSSLMANAFEALIGAVYLDSGMDDARKIILLLLKERIDTAISSGDFHDYKTELQEITQTRYGKLPEYRLVAQKGLDHEKVFTMDVFINGEHYGRGTASKKKEAQSRAAKLAVEKFREQDASQ